MDNLESNVDEHLFNQLVSKGIEAATKICNTRGSEYSDSWRGASWNFLVSVQSELVRRKCEGGQVWCRAIALACLIDIKINRYAGGKFREDTGDDLINYIAALQSTMREVVAPVFPVSEMGIKACPFCEESLVPYQEYGESSGESGDWDARCGTEGCYLQFGVGPNGSLEALKKKLNCRKKLA